MSEKGGRRSGGFFVAVRMNTYFRRQVEEEVCGRRRLHCVFCGRGGSRSIEATPIPSKQKIVSGNIKIHTSPICVRVTRTIDLEEWMERARENLRPLEKSSAFQRRGVSNRNNSHMFQSFVPCSNRAKNETLKYYTLDSSSEIVEIRGTGVPNG